MVNQLYKSLSINRLLNNVNIDDLDLNDIKGDLVSKNAGDIIYKKDDPANSIYLIISGQISLNKTGPDDSKSFVLKENNFFGNDEFFEESTRSNSATALKDCYLIRLSEDEVHNLIQQDTTIYENLRELIEEDLSEIVESEFKDSDGSLKTTQEDFQLQLDSQLEGISIDDLSIDDVYETTREKPKNETTEDTASLDIPPYGSVSSPYEIDDEILKALEEPDSFSPEADIPERNDDLADEDEAFFKNFGGDTTPLGSLMESDTKAESNKDSASPPPIAPASKSASSLINFDFDEGEDSILNELDAKISMNPDELELNEEPENVTAESEDDLILHTSAELDESFDSHGDKPESEMDKDNIQSEDSKTFSSAIKIRNEEEGDRMTPEQLEMINKAAQLVNSNIQLDDLLQNIVDVATNLTNSDRGTLYLVDKEKDELWSKVLTGDGIKEIRLKIGEGVAGWVAQNKEIVNVEDVKSDERFHPHTDKNTGYETKSMLCFPIKNKEADVIGVLQLLNSKNERFSKLDEEFLNALSTHAALALENANMVQTLLQSERVDSLGKMANFLIQDIKKPILVSKRYAEHLRGKELPPEVIQVLDMMLEQLGSVADLVQTTSSYAEGDKILHTITVSISETLADFSRRMEQFVQLKTCSINNTLDLKANVKLDVKEFFQCYSHIIKNACDAMPEGGRIAVWTEERSGSVLIHIKDEGLGIAEAMKDKIFEPFTTLGKKEGAGLGLAITRKIVEAHNGKINVESSLGEGATFTITLPKV